MTRFCWLFGFAFLFSTISPGIAEIGPHQFAFSALIPESDAIVVGTVSEAGPVSDAEYAMHFEVQEYIMGSGSRDLTISVHLIKGLQDHDQAYLEADGISRLLFLKQKADGQKWTITNGQAGVLSGEARSDVAKVVLIYQSHEALTTASAMQALQAQFWMLGEETQMRLLQDMETAITERDAPFLDALLASNIENLQSFAAIQVGSHKIHALRPQVEHLLRTSVKSQVQFHCLAGLGRFRVQESLELVLSFLNSSDAGLRKAAIHAAGFIGGPGIIVPLLARYEMEEGRWHRLAIIEAIERVPDIEKVGEALEAFRAREADPLLQSMIVRRQGRLGR